MKKRGKFVPVSATLPRPLLQAIVDDLNRKGIAFGVANDGGMTYRDEPACTVCRVVSPVDVVNVDAGWIQKRKVRMVGAEHPLHAEDDGPSPDRFYWGERDVYISDRFMPDGKTLRDIIIDKALNFVEWYEDGECLHFEELK